MSALLKVVTVDSADIPDHPTNEATGAAIDTSGRPPHDGDMERLAALEARFDAVLPNLATKADIADIRSDVHKISSDISRWTLATMVTIIGTMLAAIFGISSVYKNSTPAAAVQPAPIIIYSQPGVAQVPAAPAVVTPAK
jgi:hypothetical protein